MKTALSWLTLTSLLLAGCSSTPSRYQHKNDFTPGAIADVKALVEPTPKAEPKSTMGNAPSYRVRGKTYQVMPSAHQFKERGIASWYGMKFHGHTTSNGEIYDVYQFSAAHKSLPLPSYVRVTRVDNGQSVVVRVNDRGPFIDNRIIDLSYAAAVKLDMHKQGIAEVDIEVIQPPLDESVRWVQVAALSDAQRASQLQQRLSTQLNNQWPIQIQTSQGERAIHRVRIGPVQEGQELTQLLQELHKLNIQQPLLLAQHQL